MKEHPDILSQEEVDRLVYQTVKHAGSNGIPQDHVEMIYDWAIEARLNQTLLCQLLGGDIAASVVDGEITFSIVPR